MDSKAKMEVLHQVEIQLFIRKLQKCQRNSYPIILQKNRRKLLRITNQESNQFSPDRDLVRKDRG